MKEHTPKALRADPACTCPKCYLATAHRMVALATEGCTEEVKLRLGNLMQEIADLVDQVPGPERAPIRGLFPNASAT